MKCNKGGEGGLAPSLTIQLELRSELLPRRSIRHIATVFVATLLAILVTLKSVVSLLIGLRLKVASHLLAATLEALDLGQVGLLSLLLLSLGLGITHLALGVVLATVDNLAHVGHIHIVLATILTQRSITQHLLALLVSLVTRLATHMRLDIDILQHRSTHLDGTLTLDTGILQRHQLAIVAKALRLQALHHLTTLHTLDANLARGTMVELALVAKAAVLLEVTVGAHARNKKML